METVFADFHTHTRASDSSRTLTELLSSFLNANIQYASITDHDTLAVYEEGVLEQAASALAVSFATRERRVFQIGSLIVLSGVELSTKYNSQNQHLVGLGMRSIDDSADIAYLEQLRTNRKIRIEEMIGEINEKREGREGVYAALGDRPLSVSEFYDEIGQDAMPTRLHLGAYLWKHYSFGASPRGAMNTAVNRNLESYQFSEIAMTTESAIALVHKYEGVAIIPHLHRQSFSDLRRRGPAELSGAIQTLAKTADLDGIEVNPTDELDPMYHRLAEELQLLKSIGTDDHGENGPTYYATPAERSSRVTLEKRSIRMFEERMRIPFSF